MLKNAQSVAFFSQRSKALCSTWIEIDLKQFKKNLQCIQSQLGSALYCLPIKANAYGHGLIEIGLTAEEFGVDYLAVSQLGEGVQLREAGIKMPILVLGAFQEDQIVECVKYSLEFSISSLYKARLTHEKLSRLNQIARVHLEVETGMNRTGARPQTARGIYQYLESSPYLEVVGLYSHFVNSDDVDSSICRKQEEVFFDFVRSCPQKHLCHLSNSGALLHLPNSAFQMLRPGLLSFGLFKKQSKGPYKGLHSCFSLKSRVSYFKVVEKGQGISYGPTYKTKKRTRIATIPIGYGDGYRRALSNKGSVLIRGKRFPIVGTICMDQLMVDIQDQEAYVGDEVTLIGKQGCEEITVDEVANLCDTISYEVVSGFNERVPRFYLK